MMKISIININFRNFKQLLETCYKNKFFYAFSKFFIKSFITKEKDQIKQNDKKSNKTKRTARNRLRQERKQKE